MIFPGQDRIGEVSHLIFPGQQSQLENFARHHKGAYHLANTEDERVIAATIKLAGNELKRQGRNPRWAVVIPIRNKMIEGLAHLGIAHDNTIEDIATKFYNHIVKHEKGFKFDYVDRFVSNQGYENAATDVVSLLSTTALDYVAQLKQAEASGQALSPLQQKIVSGTDAVTGGAKYEVITMAEASLAGWIQRHLLWVIGSAIGIVLFVMVIIGWAGRGK